MNTNTNTNYHGVSRLSYLFDCKFCFDRELQGENSTSSNTEEKITAVMLSTEFPIRNLGAPGSIRVETRTLGTKLYLDDFDNHLGATKSLTEIPSCGLGN